ncbi:copper chaperone PCu(A)C [Blastococcus sp. MG754426]|uniref:copper chaperone PCu(A)C n=1 Tax=unclassified Blastococcus TaxID=2619396 RepID=UPI001EF14D70|nr:MULTISPECIES: copper chaperone PCu(A)C [unclassified Blastococcus]MCF6508621.1 copper chaperone PCu(A)C [Blastococcus sp. MG754426]MCF6513222.1 copper chaperone PCu(A)C [Blastococcus sp. MG754427]
MTRRTRRHPLAALLLAATLPLAACGGEGGADSPGVDDLDNPLDVPGDEVIGGNPGPDEAVTEDIKITALGLAFPEDGVWEVGEDVRLYAAIANTGTTGDQLVEVRGEDFAGAELVPLDGPAGTIEIPEEDNVYLEPEGPPSVLLTDLSTDLRSSQSIPVTFVFEQAGEVTMEAPVVSEPPGQGGFEAPEDPTPED